MRHEDLKAARRRAGLSQAALARLLGCSESKVTKAESGERRVSFDFYAAFMTACGEVAYGGVEPPEVERLIGQVIERHTRTVLALAQYLDASPDAAEALRLQFQTMRQLDEAKTQRNVLTKSTPTTEPA